MEFFSKDGKNGITAMRDAQWIALAPFVFQAARVIRDSGILDILEDNSDTGLSVEEVSQKSKYNKYQVQMLMESCLASGILIKKDEKYFVTKVGWFILKDEMTRINMDFTQHVCYNGIFDLEKSLENAKPEGLRFLGPWKTIYEGLSILPGKALKSWFDFDHFYSDTAFPEILPLVFANKPIRLLDIGGNTGKWAIQCIEFDKDVEITLMDLQIQLNEARKNLESHQEKNRVKFYQTDLLENKPFPGGFDAIWMSQFLDCFSEEQVISILTRCKDALNPDGRVFIVEPMWDQQKFEGGAFSLMQTSLYFTTIANGNSKFFYSKDLFNYLNETGFQIIKETRDLGVCQSLIECKLA